MKKNSPPLTYWPAYIGLYFALLLAAACNAFLDVEYGVFTSHVVIWAIVFGITLLVGWVQHGEVAESGRIGRGLFLVIGFFASILIFIPMWGFPRAGLAMLAILQAAQNCVTVTRKDLHMGLFVSAVMVMFAASHFRADWTMLFYLIPYITAVVFTLAAEQISRRAQDLRQKSLGGVSAGGRSVAIVAATTTILMVGALLYTITPQVRLTFWFWKYGQPGSSVVVGKTPGTGQAGQSQGGWGFGVSDKASIGQREMREEAKRRGMPGWQSFAILQLADLVEQTQLTLIPIKLALDNLWRDTKAWLESHRQVLIQSLLALIMLVLLISSWLFLREARVGLWVRSRLDYLLLGLLRQHAPGNAGVFQYYAAVQRLAEEQGLARYPAENVREYQIKFAYRFGHLRTELEEITQLFERARYGKDEITPGELARLQGLYRYIFINLDVMSSAPPVPT